MTHGLSRRALAASAAALAAAGIGREVAGARKKRRSGHVQIVSEGRIRLDGARLSFDRVTHVSLVADGMVRMVPDHGVLVPKPGAPIDYFVSGFRELVDEGRVEPATEPVAFGVRALGGAYDPGSGQLLLDPVEIINVDLSGELYDHAPGNPDFDVSSTLASMAASEASVTAEINTIKNGPFDSARPATRRRSRPAGSSCR